MSELETIPFDDISASAQPSVFLDRSRLEDYMHAPFKAHAIETGRVKDGGRDADVGTEAHDIISDAIAWWIEAGEPPRDYLREAVYQARPDILPDVVDALKRSIWWIDRYLTGRSQQDIILHDGGQKGDKNAKDEEKRRSRDGQLGMDLLPATEKRGCIIPTSELDLLIVGESPEVVYETDWKSGRKVWTPTQVKKSFQFRFHALLIFKNFPAVKAVYTQVFMTRMCQATELVRFAREEIEQTVEGQVLGAVRAREEAFKAKDPNEIPCWCTPEECSFCPAVHICPHIPSEASEKALADDPLSFALGTSVLDQLLIRRKKLLREFVDDRGSDLDMGDLCYGLNMPKAVRKPKSDQYKFYKNPNISGEKE